MSALEVISRGRDSSGRPLKGTRQAFQHFDRVNVDAANGKLVIVQGAWSSAAASAGTHSKAGCFDIRTWNLTTAERDAVLKRARELMAAAWYRHQGQGFDPHIHWVLIGDAPMDSLAAAQIDMYRKGYNGLGWYAYKDDFYYRPKKITEYKYLEDDMFEEADRKMLAKIYKRLDEGMKAEWGRDENERLRQGKRFSRIIDALGKQADLLTLAINKTDDPVEKADLKKMKAEILTALKEDPDVDGVDNPSDEAMNEL